VNRCSWSCWRPSIWSPTYSDALQRLKATSGAADRLA
jgi:hypothetical protein